MKMSMLRYGPTMVVFLGTGTFISVPSMGQSQAGQGNAASIPTPRTASGHPDLSGRWGGPGGGGAGVQAIEPDGTEFEFDTFADYQAALTAGDVSRAARIIGRQPNYRHGNNVYAERDDGMRRRYFANPPLYKPEFWERVEYLDVNGNLEDMTFICMPEGVPRMGPPMRILQPDTDVVLLYQHRNTWRVVPTDGRPHDSVNAFDQTFLGDSVGRWEGETLVIDVVGFNDLTWLGWPGWFHTNEMRVEERFTREGNTLRYEVTVHDPAVLIQPWEMDPILLDLNPGTATYLEDAPCLDFDAAHMVTRERG